MKVLVCGGRDYGDRQAVYDALDRLEDVDAMICGGARGADRLAQDWAGMRGIVCRAYPADWEAHGRAAGPIRNQQMLDVEKPDLVVAFPGGRGTADMVERAIAAGVPVFHPRTE